MLALVCLSACRSPSVESRWLHEPEFRRHALERSLVKDTQYGRLRREEWSAWQALPEWAPLPIPEGARTGDHAALAAFGRDAFLHWPLQPAPASAREGEHGLRSLAMVEGKPWLTCATCHAHGGVLGVANHDLDLGAALLDAHPHAPPEARAIALSWGKGRVDVSTSKGDEPAQIPDLRPVRFQRWIQWSGAVRQHDVTSLAARLETLMITNASDRRPPPVVTLALAVFLHQLGGALPPVKDEPLFVEHCGGCHAGPGLAGGLVDVEEVGTDPLLARSRERGTGAYRITSLRGLGTRGALLHDGSIPDLAALLSPERAGGHRYGLELSDADRARLLAFLGNL